MFDERIAVKLAGIECAPCDIGFETRRLAFLADMRHCPFRELAALCRC